MVRKQSKGSKKSKAKSYKRMGSEIIDLVPASQIKDTFCEIGEVALDAAMDESVWRDLPVIGTIIRIGGAILTIKDRIFLKKITRFLRTLEEIPDKNKTDFVAEMKAKKTKVKVGEKLLLLLDKQQDLDKAALVGEAFSLYVRGQIDLEKFESVSHAITLCYFEHLKYLTLVTGPSGSAMLPNDFPNEIASTFTAIGVTELLIDTFSATKSGLLKSRKSYKLSGIGELLMTVFKNWRKKTDA